MHRTVHKPDAKKKSQLVILQTPFNDMSRQELVQWVNELLQTEISKVEECGKGAIYCQIMDSIYGDVPMSKVKFNVKAEYEFLNNYKVLQGVFNRHKIDRQIPVEKLVKCRFQDNLEFLQYCKKHWDANWSGQEYDAVGRRAGRVATVPSTAPGSTPNATSGRTSVQSQTSGRSSVVRSRPSVASGPRARLVLALEPEPEPELEVCRGLRVEPVSVGVLVPPGRLKHRRPL